MSITFLLLHQNLVLLIFKLVYSDKYVAYYSVLLWTRTRNVHKYYCHQLISGQHVFKLFIYQKCN